MIFASHHLIVFFIRKLEEPVDFRWKCTEKPRDDHDAPSWLQATEFEDSEAVLMESKVLKCCADKSYEASTKRTQCLHAKILCNGRNIFPF
eukprot:m.250857 g.250857  ORF g.250857 m.250857 type:complete len:91 (-) comp19534_c0_seq4:1486-1758(-)